MSVNYKSVGRRNPQDSSQPEKYYATAISKGTTDLKKLASLLSDGSTTRISDVYAVLIGLVEEIKKELSEGRAVKLGDLGTFKVGINAEGADTPEEVNPSKIIRRKIAYRVSADLKKMLNNLDFEKLSE